MAIQNGVGEFVSKEEAYDKFHKGAEVRVIHVDNHKVINFDTPEMCVWSWED